MLERIERIQGVGLLHNVNGKALKLSKTQLIYADNGRGKSTMASIFRSVATGDATAITERKTIDSSDLQFVSFAFDSGHKVSFEDGVWSESRPELIIFDADFVEKNVHSGGVVTPGQRKNLLQFALGAKSVKARELEVQASKEATQANAEVKQLIKQLAGYHDGETLPIFQGLTVDPDAEQKIEALRKRIIAANNVGALLARPLPEVVPLPSFDIEALFKILNASLDDVQEDAEETVTAHFQRMPSCGVERWVGEGRQFEDGLHCPYCAQDVSEVGLVKAYKTYFNKAYEDLKKQVAILERGVLARAGDSIVDRFYSGVSKANAAIAQWHAELGTTSVFFSDLDARRIVTSLREHLLELVQLKLNKPLEVVGGAGDKRLALELWEELGRHFKFANESIESANKEILEYRGGLAKEDAVSLERQAHRLHLTGVRHRPEVIELFESLGAAKKKSAEAERVKLSARESLNSEMAKVLTSYQESINSFLARFGASFEIEKMDSNYRGGIGS